MIRRTFKFILAHFFLSVGIQWDPGPVGLKSNYLLCDCDRNRCLHRTSIGFIFKSRLWGCHQILTLTDLTKVGKKLHFCITLKPVCDNIPTNTSGMSSLVRWSSDSHEFWLIDFKFTLQRHEQGIFCECRIYFTVFNLGSRIINIPVFENDTPPSKRGSPESLLDNNKSHLSSCRYL